MKYQININMENDAFSGGNNTSEVCRILHALADRIGLGGELLEGDTETLRDVNGNTVGKAEATLDHYSAEGDAKK